MQATDVPFDMTLTLTVNGVQQAITVDVRTSLLDLLRERLQVRPARRKAVITANAALARCM